MKFSLSSFQSIVRPFATLVMIIAFVVYAVLYPDAFERIKEVAIAVIMYWFGRRESNSNAS